VARKCEQRYGIDFNEVYASVVRMETIRTLFALSVQELHIHHRCYYGLCLRQGRIQFKPEGGGSFLNLTSFIGNGVHCAMQ